MSKEPSNQGSGPKPADPEQEDTIKLPGLGHLELPEPASPVYAPTATGTAALNTAASGETTEIGPALTAA